MNAAKGKPVSIQHKTNFLSASIPFFHQAASHVAEFRIPASCLEMAEELELHILAQTDSQLTPMTIVGTSGPISDRLSKHVMSGNSSTKT